MIVDLRITVAAIASERSHHTSNRSDSVMSERRSDGLEPGDAKHFADDLRRPMGSGNGSSRCSLTGGDE